MQGSSSEIINAEPEPTRSAMAKQRTHISAFRIQSCLRWRACPPRRVYTGSWWCPHRNSGLRGQTAVARLYSRIAPMLEAQVNRNLNQDRNSKRKCGSRCKTLMHGGVQLPAVHSVQFVCALDGSLPDGQALQMIPSVETVVLPHAAHCRLLLTSSQSCPASHG